MKQSHGPFAYTPRPPAAVRRTHFAVMSILAFALFCAALAGAAVVTKGWNNHIAHQMDAARFCGAC